MTAAPSVGIEAELRRAAAFRSALRGFSARTEEVAAAAGLTPRRYDLLLAIRAAPDATSTATRLSQQLRLRQTAVTELVKRAEARLLLRTPAALPARPRTPLCAAQRVPAAQDFILKRVLGGEGEQRLLNAFDALRRERERVRQALREVGARFREYAAGAAETT